MGLEGWIAIDRLGRIKERSPTSLDRHVFRSLQMIDQLVDSVCHRIELGIIRVLETKIKEVQRVCGGRGGMGNAR